MDRITEAANPATRDLDLLTTEDMLRIIHSEDARIHAAVQEVLPALARAVDATAERLQNGGRVFYVGAGTSGRLGVLDASEIPPTFGVSGDLFQGVIAGGYEACHSASEVSEDDPEQGGRDLRRRGCAASDVVVGIAASGATPYTIGAIEWARSMGALTIVVCCNPDSPLSSVAEHAVTPVVGPEVLAGSTRMKAGTAQKLVLNMFSTAVMVKLGYVYGNWMINVQMTNSKLKERGLRILKEITGASEDRCREALSASDSDLRVALVMLLAGIPAREARKSLETARWNVRKTVGGRGESS